jgi:peptidoglycan/LPS O-acetylase OafA/YrhL
LILFNAYELITTWGFKLHSPIIKPASYLKHIDGLRAIAVLSIVLFHFDVNLLNGGYVGVDIFFVISGFLITSHISTEIKNNTFRFSDFYGRRVRRLLPALIVTLAGCLIAGYLILPPAHFAAQGLNTVQAILSIANIGFWLDSGYFSADALLKPLLHTWSLSVEEQFYLFWPGFLLIMWRLRLLRVAIAITAIISLISAEYWLQRDASAVFFLTPFRVFEFCVGAFLYWINDKKASKTVLNIVATLGLTLIVSAILFYTEQTRFPGAAALLPCLGTALLIYAGAHSYVGKLLTFSPLVYIGLISYSLYLVHWPIVVFYKYLHLPTLQAREQILLLAGSIVLASIMYHFVETPFRTRASRSFRVRAAYFFPAVLCFVVLLAVSGWRIQNMDTSDLQVKEMWSIADVEEGKEKRYKQLSGFCKQDGRDNCKSPSNATDKNVLILGDSHAVDGLNIFSIAYPEYHYVLKSLPGGCPPIAPQDFNILSPRHPNRDECINFNQTLFNNELLKDYETIIISVFFQWYRAEHLMNTVNSLRHYTDAKIIVLGNFISLKRALPDINAETKSALIEKVFNSPELIGSFSLDEEKLLNYSINGQFKFVSKKDLLCLNDDISSCKLFFNDVPFSYDEHHLSYEASNNIALTLKQRFPTLSELTKSQ